MIFLLYSKIRKGPKGMVRIFCLILFCFSITGFSQSFTVDFPRKTVLSLENRPQWGTQIELGWHQGTISYQVYFIYQQNAQRYNVSFMNFQEARRQNKIQLDVINDNIILRSWDSHKWLFIPYGYSYEINSTEKMVFFQDFFLGPSNSTFCPIIAMKLKKETIKELSFSRLIELLSSIRVTKVSPKNQKTVHACILVDISLNMKNAIQNIKISLESILKQYKDMPNVYFSIVTFASHADVMIPLSKVSEINLQDIYSIKAKTEEKWKYENGKGIILHENLAFTNTYAAMQKAQEILRQEKDQYQQEIQRSIILISNTLPFFTQNMEIDKNEVYRIFQEEIKKVRELANRFKQQGIECFIKFPCREENIYKIYDLKSGELPSANIFYNQIAQEYTSLNIREIQQAYPTQFVSLLEGESLLSAYYINPEKLNEILGKSDRKDQDKERIQNIQMRSERELYKKIVENSGNKIIGLYMFQNDNRFIMLDLFSHSDMLLVTAANVARRYVQQMISFSNTENTAEYEFNTDKIEILKMLLSSINTTMPDETYKQLYRGENQNKKYEIARLSLGTVIGFYISLGEDIFHVCLLDKSN